MDPRIEFIFATLEDANIGLHYAAQLFDGAVTRATLDKWKKGTPPRSALAVRVVYGYATLVRRAVDRGLLPIKGRMPNTEKLATYRSIVRAMKDVV